MQLNALNSKSCQETQNKGLIKNWKNRKTVLTCSGEVLGLLWHCWKSGNGTQTPSPVDLCAHEVLQSGRGYVSPKLISVWFPRLNLPLSALLTALLEVVVAKTFVALVLSCLPLSILATH